MSHHKIFGLSFFAWMILASQTSYAGFIFSFDTTQLEVQATGGIVTQQVDLRITHDGSGLNTFSDYELQISPSSSAVIVVTGPVDTSDFNFDLHSVTGTNPFYVAAVNFVSNVSASTGSNDVLAQLTFQVDTSVFTSGSIALNPTIISLGRDGVLGSSILSEASVTAASINVTAVPEPSSAALVLLAASSALLGKRRFNRKVG